MSTQEQRARFGEAVRRLRDARGWSQHDLAQRMGLADSTVAGWEQGRDRGAREENVRALEDLFDLDRGELGSILGQARHPRDMPATEDAIKADPRIPEHDKRTLLAHLAEVRRLAEEGK